MTIAQLILHLQDLVKHGANPQDKVRVYCPDADGMVAAGATIYGGGFCDVLPEENDEDYV
jgi:hypothetical protein